MNCARASTKAAAITMAVVCLFMASACARGPNAKLPDWSGAWVLRHDSAIEASEDSFGTDGGRVPLTPEYMALRAKAHAERAQNPLSMCLPAGTPGVLTHGITFEFLFTPGRATMLFEDGEVRRIYTDGRAHRPLSEIGSTYMGESIGHWEDATLVVDTIGFPNGSLFQNHGLLSTFNTHLVERIHREGDEIVIESTISDPRIFARPYVYSRSYRQSPFPMGEPGCQAANRDTGESVDLTPPPENE